MLTSITSSEFSYPFPIGTELHPVPEEREKDPGFSWATITDQVGNTAYTMAWRKYDSDDVSIVNTWDHDDILTTVRRGERFIRLPNPLAELRAWISQYEEPTWP